jgi:hypothetical protein
MGAQALCRFSDLKSYLTEIEELDLLENIESEGDRYGVSQTYREREANYAKSIRLQVAAMLAVLGEFERAEAVHKIAWEILSPSYDKVANGIIQRFIQPRPNL